MKHFRELICINTLILCFFLTVVLQFNMGGYIVPYIVQDLLIF